MRRLQRSRALPLVLARAIAPLAVVATLAFGVLGAATGFSPGTGSAGASSAHPSNAYSGGIMMAADPTGGYWTVTPAGAVTPHGAAPALGSPALSNLRLAQPIVGMTATTDGNGYWLVAADGGIFSYGDATFYGSTGGMHLNKPIVGMATANDGNGYWLVASDGGIFSYGDAVFHGSTGSIVLNKPVVGMGVTNDGNGYWLVASDGGIFSYGDAVFHGSTGSIRLNQPIVGMAPTPDGAGYWLVAADGGIFSYGDAVFHGSTAGTGVSVLGLVINPAISGYSIVTTSGSASSFGSASSAVSTQPQSSTTLAHPQTSTTATTSACSAPAGLQQGAYAGSGNPAGIAAFGAETGTSPTIATDYLNGGTGWAGMDGSDGSLGSLLDAWHGSGYTLSLGVPIIPTTSSGLPVGTLAQGATGAFNSYYVTLAQTLINAGESNAYLRLGWEFDGSWELWRATTPSGEASFAAYFQQIVTAMRSVPGENFCFVWNPDASAFTQSGYSVALAYPGNAYVDVIGLEVYDQSWSTTSPSDSFSTHLPALTAAQEFASSKGKPLALSEWGVVIRTDGYGLGDDPNFINDMASWMKDPSNDVTYETYFSADGGGMNTVITDGLFPNSLAAFKADFG